MMARTRRIMLTAAAAVFLVAGAVGARQLWLAMGGRNVEGGAQREIPAAAARLTEPRAGTADWPRWRGVGGDGRSLVSGIPTSWSNGLRKRWQVNYLCQGKGTATWGAPSVSGNRLVVPGRAKGQDLLFALDPNSGRLLWSRAYPAEDKAGYGSGARASPTIDGDRVYTFGRRGDLACWALHDGKLLWRVNVAEFGGEEPKWGCASSPLIYGDMVVVQGGGEAQVLALDKMSGELRWRSGPGAAGYAAVTVMETGGATRMLAFHAWGLAVLDPQGGRTTGSVPWATDYDVNATTPMVDGSTVFITSGYGTGATALRVGPESVEELWRSEVIASHHSDPIVLDGFLYGYTGQSNQNSGDFKCVELSTGVERWSTDEIGWGNVVWVDGYLLAQDIKGNLFLVKPDPDRFQKVAEFRGALGDVRSAAWTGPVVANGKLFLRYLERLICFDLQQN